MGRVVPTLERGGVSGNKGRIRLGNGHTPNWNFDALGVMIVISCAVDAFCIAFPGLAKETLPTRTLCTTVLERLARQTV